MDWQVVATLLLLNLKERSRPFLFALTHTRAPALDFSFRLSSAGVKGIGRFNFKGENGNKQRARLVKVSPRSRGARPDPAGAFSRHCRANTVVCLCQARSRRGMKRDT
ncbi:hypothetical protein AAFF_G00349270 [Aldrovandia affinis]|uniref:Uncharacterized protein n=1 Tax=Aldrovandia affinis TaxID=143900 RepID=A0AAD7WNI4_9TELE|nr:hypothetical protein AAFF_G00349270 [Aldrovandia affinis]